MKPFVHLYSREIVQFGRNLCIIRRNFLTLGWGIINHAKIAKLTINTQEASMSSTIISLISENTRVPL